MSDLLIGCHLSTANGYAAMADDAVSIGATTFAFFTRNPRGGNARELDEKDLEPLLVCALGYPAPDECVVVEGAGSERGLAYWRERGDDAWVHHVPKLGLDDLLV